MTKKNSDVVMAEMKKDIEYVKKEITEWVNKRTEDNTLNREEHQEILGALKGLDKKFASKLVEKIVYGACTLVGAGIITALIAFIIKGGFS